MVLLLREQCYEVVECYTTFSPLFNEWNRSQVLVTSMYSVPIWNGIFLIPSLFNGILLLREQCYEVEMLISVYNGMFQQYFRRYLK